MSSQKWGEDPCRRGCPGSFGAQGQGLNWRPSEVLSDFVIPTSEFLLTDVLSQTL